MTQPLLPPIQPPDEELFPEMVGAVITETPPEMPPPVYSDAPESTDEISSPPIGLNMSEAPASLHTVLFTKTGGWVSMTVRGIDAIQTLKKFVKTVSFAIEHYGMSATKVESAPQQPSAKTANSLFPPPPQETSGVGEAPDESRDKFHGVNELLKLVISHEDTKPKLKVYVKGFQWPFTDARGPKAWVKLFDPRMKITEELLLKPSITEFGGGKQEMLCEWEHPEGSKYYNVVRIYPKEK